MQYSDAPRREGSSQVSRTTIAVRAHETAAELSQSFDSALIDLLKVVHHMPGSEQISPRRLAEASRSIGDIIFVVERALSGKWVDTHAHSTPELPDGLAAWLQATHQGDALRPHRLASVRAHVTQPGVQLSGDDVAVLQKLSRVFDAQAAHLFQRLTHEAS